MFGGQMLFSEEGQVVGIGVVAELLIMLGFTGKKLVQECLGGF